MKLLVDHGADVNLRSSNGITALHMVARSGNRKVAEILIACREVEINSRDKTRQTPLHVACTNGDKDLCALLLGNGADPRMKSAEEKTPLHMAVSGGNAHVARLILDAGMALVYRFFLGNMTRTETLLSHLEDDPCNERIRIGKTL